MSTLTRNLLSNVVERGISTILTLVVLPFQVRLLGIDAYGILGFVASLQVLFNILDLGLGPTVIREIASSSVAAKPRSTQRPLFESLTTVYWAIALASGVVLAGSARWIAVHWLQAGTLPTETVVLAIRLIAMSVLLRWPVALYAGAMAGAQRLDLVNVIRIIVSVLKLLGGLAVLVYSRALMPYLLWLTLVSLLEIGMYMFMSIRVVPGLSLRAGFSRAALGDIWRFSLHMNLMSMLAVLFVQADRMVISRILPVAELGFYSVAYSIVTGLSMLQNIVTAALFPALAQHVSRGQWTEIRTRCRTAVQLLMYVLCGITCVLIFYGRDLLGAWISADVAARSAVPTAILAVGFTLAAAVSVPYTLSVAAGRTGVPLVVNILAIVVYLPAIYWAVQSWGISGAAWSWLGLNTYYLLVLLPLMQRNIPMEPMFGWVVRNLCVFGGLGIVAVGASHLLSGNVRGPLPAVAGAIGGGLAYAAVGFLFLEPSLHRRLKNWRTTLITLTPHGPP